MNVSLQIAFALLLAVCAQAADTSIPVVNPKDSRSIAVLNEHLAQEIKTIKLHKVSFRETPVKCVYRWLEEQAYERAPDLRIVFDFSVVNALTLPDQPNAPRPKIPGLDDEPVPHGQLITPIEMQVTVELADVSFGEALQYVTGIVNLRARIENGQIVISAIELPIQTKRPNHAMQRTGSARR